MTAAVPAFGFTPGIEPRDPLARYWLEQVWARARRELCWVWSSQRASADAAGPRPALGAIDDVLTRLPERRAREEFFRTDDTARFLSDCIDAPEPDLAAPMRGGFSWVISELGLDDAACFVLALSLATVVNSAAGAVLAACANDGEQFRPTLRMAQRLWDAGDELLPLLDPAHPLYRVGLLVPPAPLSWESALQVPGAVAGKLAFPAMPGPAALSAVIVAHEPRVDGDDLVVSRLAAGAADRLRVVPVLGASGEHAAAAQMVSQRRGRSLWVVAEDRDLIARPGYLDALATWAWLDDADLYLPVAFDATEPPSLPRDSIPATVFAASHRRRPAAPAALCTPTLRVLESSFSDRLDCWRAALGAPADGSDATLAEVARRFRYDRPTIDRVAAGMDPAGPITMSSLVAACRAELGLDFAGLAEELVPRFGAGDLVLPGPQQRLFDEILRAMGALTTVHYSWGTARGVARGRHLGPVRGPPGTGKTMAAEVPGARAGPADLPGRPLPGGQQVHRRDREEPAAGVRRRRARAI